MSLPDTFFLWPYRQPGLQECIDEITPVLAKSALAPYVRCKEGNLAEHIASECRARNINPWWLLTSAQREQSAITSPALTNAGLAAWLGVVGQDSGRATWPGYYGVYLQVSRFCEVCSWLLGVEDALAWPAYWRARKETKRYKMGLTVSVQQPDGTWVDVLPTSRGDFLQLSFTPHHQTLANNEIIAHSAVPVPLKYFGAI